MAYFGGDEVRYFLSCWFFLSSDNYGCFELKIVQVLKVSHNFTICGDRNIAAASGKVQET